MSGHVRFGVYYAPPAGSDLARFGAAWLGWDAENECAVAHPEIDGVDVAAVTSTPRKYGFHGTLKPPFRLAPGTGAADLSQALEAFSGNVASFEAPALSLQEMGKFIALVPGGPSAELAALAGRCVADLDRFRAPPGAEELARRRRAGLSPAEDANLQRWGYPYVMDSFRFHLTLTGALEPKSARSCRDALADLTRPFCIDPLPVHEICLFGERPNGRFHLIRRYPLRG